jgi:1,4-alpha-glucan branching enzyme
MAGNRSALLAASLALVACAGEVDDRGGLVLTQGVSCAGGSRAGMGAIVSGGGASFRVWAPLAAAVWVTGDFNGWGWTALCGEGNGNFSGDVAIASAGQRY